MYARIVAAGAFALCLFGCPPPTPNVDGGEVSDSGNPQTGPCTGGCGPTQVCNPTTHACEDGCGGCDAGVCTKNAAGAFQCVPTTTACNGVVCGQGQAACISGGCSCIGPGRASRDTCSEEGQVCNEPYNPVTRQGGSCDSPKFYQACKIQNCPSGACPGCPAGQICDNNIFGDEDNGVCMKSCTAPADCNRDEYCGNTGSCFARAFFGDNRCTNRLPADGGTYPDGGAAPSPGLVETEVPVSNACLVRGENGQVTDVGAATGNCTYSLFRLNDSTYALPNCRPPGTAALNAACKRDFSVGTLATQCGTGLECVLTNGDNGLCLKLCNAAEPRFGVAAAPACASGESCVNLFRQTEPNAVVGVCMKSCNVFSSTGQSCAAYGSTPASCVPTNPSGRALASTDGSGVCTPQKTPVAALGQPCAETDPFKGASCASGLACNVGSGSPTCEKPCDLSCAVASPPARCATQANATCATGKACTPVTTTTGTTLGFCR